MEAILVVFVVLFIFPLFGWAVVWLIRSMVMGDVGAVAGVFGLGCLFMMLVLIITGGSPAVSGALTLILGVSLVFFPLAMHRLGVHELREINAGLIDKLHAGLAERPDNYAGYFALSEALYNQGFQGHAIGLASRTLEGMRDNLDDAKFQSLRMMFHREEALLKQWIRESDDPRLHQPIACPSCGFANPPGNLACGGCRGPFLLEVVRRGDQRISFLGRLVMVWGCLALGLGGAVYFGFAVTGSLGVLAALACVAVAGGVVAVLIKAPRGDGSRPERMF